MPNEWNSLQMAKTKCLPVNNNERFLLQAKLQRLT